MTSRNGCTSGTSRVLTEASLKRLKMEPLIPAPADCDMRSVIKFCLHGAKQLTPEFRVKRMESVLSFLHRYHDDGDDFLKRIITGDKKWVAHITPETKRQSKHWRYNGSPLKTKFKPVMSARKVMCTVFWGRLVPIPGGRLLRHRDTKLRTSVMSQFRDWICWKLAHTYCFFFNISFH